MRDQLALPLGVTQRWRDRQHSWCRLSEGGFDRRRYDVATVEQARAKEFVLAHHYSGTFPAARMSFGMFESGELVGVVVLGIPVRAEVLTGPFPDLQPYRESLELSRLVILDRVPGNAETWAMARVFELLRRDTEVRALVAFSDPVPRRRRGGPLLMPGHWGACYQAKGAVFLGRGRARWLTMLPDGSVLSDRAQAKVIAGDTGWRYVVKRLVALGALAWSSESESRSASYRKWWLATALLRVGAEPLFHGGNLRYGFPLDPHVRLGIPAGRYPKRDGQW